jgi:hypothetical protein
VKWQVGEISWHLFNAPVAKFIEEIKFDFENQIFDFQKKKNILFKISQSLHKI